MMLTLFLAETANAQPSDRFPEHTTVTRNGIRYEAFDLGGFTELLRMDADLTRLTNLVSLLEQEVEARNEAQESLEDALASCEYGAEVLQSERNRLRKKWEEENRLRLQAETRTSTRAVAGWALAVTFLVTSVVLAGLAAGLAL